MLSLFVLLYVLIIAIFKTIVFFICAISIFFDNMLNKIKSNQIIQTMKNTVQNNHESMIYGYNADHILRLLIVLKNVVSTDTTK